MMLPASAGKVQEEQQKERNRLRYDESTRSGI